MEHAARAKVFTCPKCKRQYWGGPKQALPDCPHCGYDHRTREGFRFDLLFLMVLILAMFGFLLLTSTYRGGSAGSFGTKAFQEHAPEKLPGR
jgi:hypothetical protein